MIEQVQLTLHAPLHRGDVIYELGWTALTDREVFNFHFRSESEKKDNPLAFRRLLFYKEQTLFC